ncbi:MAG: hypothetical protein WCP11_00500 [Candidatus Saccharibacteria bacterium]
MPPINQPTIQPVITPATPAAVLPTPEAKPGDKPQQPKPQNPNSAQNSLLLSEVRDDMVIMSDGSFRAVIACKSINFDLMSSREREGVEYSYQNFLNALNHPVQITIRSQRVDIAPYLDKLANIRNKQDNMLLNVLIDDYINFIDLLSQEANIMDKSFFISVPYFPNGDISNLVSQSKGFFGKLFGSDKNKITKIDTNEYEKAKTEIKNRVNGVMSGLFQIGIQSIQLETKELGELYYNFYNPDTAVNEPLIDFENTTSTYVKKGQGDPPASPIGVIS